MGRFYEGDRVRLGEMRGGVVIRHHGQLRVRFPLSGDRLLWLDRCVPDEGPDGRIYPASYDTCQGCGNPTRGDVFCVNCERRAIERAGAVYRAEARREQRAHGIHIASSIRFEGRTVEQRCARCGILLQRYLGEALMPPLFPEGALVERTYGGDGLAKDQTGEATCTPVREAVAI